MTYLKQINSLSTPLQKTAQKYTYIYIFKNFWLLGILTQSNITKDGKYGNLGILHGKEVQSNTTQVYHWVSEECFILQALARVHFNLFWNTTDAGFIAMYATLASRDVDCCLIPESPFFLEGEGGLFEFVEKRLKENGHMVIVIAEGAGQELLSETRNSESEQDASGNKQLRDVGLWISHKIKVYIYTHSWSWSFYYHHKSTTVNLHKF